MGSLSRHHEELKNGNGKCSVPMWSGDGGPNGFCDRAAYGQRPPSQEIKRWDGSIYRIDGRYSGYVPALACQRHGGPSLGDVAHQGDPCKYCGIPHDDVEIGPCQARIITKKAD